MCFEVAKEVEDRYGWPVVRGVYCVEPDFAVAVLDGRVYEHDWNRLPDGSILDATAGQFNASGPIVRVIPPGSREHGFYRSWDEVPSHLIRDVGEVVECKLPYFFMRAESRFAVDELTINLAGGEEVPRGRMKLVGSVVHVPEEET